MDDQADLTKTDQPELTPEQLLKPFTRFNGYRPRSLDPKYPEYDPNRDFGQIGYWVNFIRNVGNTEMAGYWVEVMERLLPEQLAGTDEDISSASGQQLAAGFEAIKQFLVDARGGVPLDQPEPSRPMGYGDFVTIQEALKGLTAVDRHAMVPLLGMLGVCALDMLFFAARQDFLIGREGPYTMGELLPIMQRVAFAAWDEQPEDESVIAAVSSAVRYARAAGFRASQINAIVDRTIAGQQ